MVLKIRLAWAFLRAYLTTVPGVLDTSDGRWFPKIAGADGEGDGGDDDGAGAGSGADDSGDDDSGGADDDDDDGSGAIDMSDPKQAKRAARKHERRAERERKAREKAEADLAKLRKDGQSASERAVEEAKEQARREAQQEIQAERRKDRLELATTRSAARGVKVDVDGEKKTVRFADPDDALIYIEAAIRRGDLSEDDIFNGEGKVQADALDEALVEILEKKPQLAADAATGGAGRPRGGSDAGKGSGGSSDLESMSVDDHFKDVRRK